MEHTRGRTRNGRSTTTSDTFTGTVWRDPVLTTDGIAINTIIFEPGAHTYWHSHSGGQLLFIDHGEGVVATRDGEVKSLRAADVVYAPAREEHWHGAAPGSYLAQTTVSMGTTEWLEALAPEVYEETARRAVQG